MIRRTLKRVRRPFSEPRSIIRYDMFDRIRTEREIKSAQKLERIYHKGQLHAWDGKKLLAQLLKKHGSIQLSDEKIAPLCRIFAVIFWGEMAAWRVSTELATEISDLEAKMAATAQAHDEARHFYVMHDYLSLLGYKPQRLPKAAAQILESVLTADNLAKKIMGMQLMVEPVALTLFQVVRESQLEPVLCELLAYYERDEARHVALGVQHLPVLISKMSTREKLDLLLWELKLFSLEIDALKEMEEDIRALGFHPRDVIRIGQTKQLHAARLLEEQAPGSIRVEKFVTRLIDSRMAFSFPEEGKSARHQRILESIKALMVNGQQSREISEELNHLRTEDVFTATTAHAQV